MNALYNPVELQFDKANRSYHLVHRNSHNSLSFIKKPNLICVLLYIYRLSDGGLLPLQKSKLNLAVRIAQEISLNPQMLDTVVHLPNSFLKLRTATSLTFNDAPWITDNGILSSFQLVSSEIPNDVAEKLGGQSLRKLVSGTDKGKNASSLSCPSANIL